MKNRISISIILIICLGSVVSGLMAGQNNRDENQEISSALFQNLLWRNIGPANMVGRVSDIEGVPGDPRIVYVASASGGIWKTVNGGVSWKPIFDKQSIASIGDLAIEPNNHEVIYAGTGESNVRNSVSFGNGVYKSMDGGKNWIYLGLQDTEHISRIIIDPKNPATVFVGALGHAYGPNVERGVFRSINGGETWRKVLYTDNRHGIADMDINPENPNIVYAALWRFERKPWTFISGDEQGGVYRSTDGGRNWNKLVNGLPRMVGRIGIKVAPNNPDVVYVMTESKEGTLFRSENKGDSFKCVSKDVQIVSRGFYYTDLKIDPADENRIYAISSRLLLSIDGGVSFKRISPTTHVDYHSLWIDPLNPERIWQGQDGGVCVSYDRGITWDYVNNFCAAQFYQIYADNREPFYYVGGGLQDNGTWYGPSQNKEPFGILNDDWRMISFGDGFHIIVHPDDHELFLSESQGGNIVRTNMRTREQQSVSPQERRADGAPVFSLKYRFNWNTPIVLSPHNKNTIYVGGNVVFKSTDFGSTWNVISPDLTTNDPEKQGAAGGPPWPENTTAEYHCTIISLAESPVQPGVLWVGTDDGNLYVSMDGGENWSDIRSAVPGLPDFSPVSHIEPSSTSAGMAYCAFDRHMLDDFSPYIYKTTDFGRTWIKVIDNLSEKAYVWVVREDSKNSRIIYAGTELGFYVSFNRGENWIKFHCQNFPTVAVHDILTHSRDNDLILGTHGRGIWIFDSISFLQEIFPEMLQQPAYIFTVRPALRFVTKPTRYGIGDGVFSGTNPAYGALITYYLKDVVEDPKDIRLEIMNDSREIIRTIYDIPQKSGLNRVSWDLRHDGPRPRSEEKIEVNFFFRGPRGHQVVPGIYTVRLFVNGQTFEKPVEVQLDPLVKVSEEDLTLQSQFCRQLRDEQSFVNDALRVLDLIKRQIQERIMLVKNQQTAVPDELKEALEQNKKIVDSLLDNMIRPEGSPFWSEGPRHFERLQSLFGAIDGVNAAPTQEQIKYFNELQNEFNVIISNVNDYITKTVVDLNNLLQKYNAPLVMLPDLIRPDISQ